MYTYRIEQALRAVTILHKDQVRKGSVPLPYVSHLFAVAMIAVDYTNDEDVLITALLHDTLEDTDYTPDELQTDFGGKVREYVEALTEPADTDKKKYSWKETKEMYAKHLRKAPQEALLVAAADKIHNMRAMVEEYYDDHSRFMKEFSGSLEDRLIQYQEIANVLNRNLKSDILNEFNHVFTEYKNFISDVQKTKNHENDF
jgi:(p)ppGpp synthase/HD superfamily hydrolase